MIAPSSVPISPAPLLFVFAALLTVGLGANACTGGASKTYSDGANAVLGTVTRIVDPIYASAVTACDQAEKRIVERTGTTEEQDRTDLATVREHCDIAFDAFDAVREAQKAARLAVDLASSGSPETLDEAEAKLVSLAKAAEHAKRSWDATERAIRK